MVDCWSYVEELRRTAAVIPKKLERATELPVALAHHTQSQGRCIQFLSLLLNRTRFSPEQWAPYDNKQLCSGWCSGAFDVDFNYNAIIMHGEGYGQLTSWDKKSAEKWDKSDFLVAN